MSPRIRSRDHAVLLVAIAVLPWVALSRLGEWPVASSPSPVRDGEGIQALTSRAIVASDRVLFSATGKRADGTRHVVTTPPSVVAHTPTVRPDAETCSWDTDVPVQAIALLLGCRDPPLNIPA